MTLMAASIALASCGGEQAPRDYTPDIEESERRLGAEQHPQLLAEFGGAYDGPEAGYVARLGEKVAQGAGLAGQCTFTLVNTDVVNAFAVPGCYIYVTRGLMALVNSEAELASVLAHELGHIVADHSERQQKRSIFRELGVLAVGWITGSEELTRIAGQAAQLFTLRYSRSQEYEADDLGLRYLQAAGYVPGAAARMLAALERQESYRAGAEGSDDAHAIPEWARTHPLTGNRIERARAAAQAAGAAPGRLVEGEQAYLRELDGLLYGDDPEQGFVRGRRFLHPGMRIGFEAPPGFTLTNTPQAVLLMGPDGIRGQFAGGALGRGGLEAYVERLAAGLFEGAPAEAGRAVRTRINGLPALILPIAIRSQEGSAEAVIAAYDAGGGDAYHFVALAPPGADTRALEPLFGSFGRLSGEAAASLRPRVIRTLAPAPGQSARDLAARMASEDPLAHFLMLNALEDAGAVRPDDPVKIVTYAR